MGEDSSGAARLTGAVIARDAERQLRGCLASLAWSDELLVLVDDRTRDASEQIARELGARVAHRRFDHFAGQRNAALDLVRTGWALFLDADERVTPELATEVREALGAPGAAPVGYWLPRRNLIWGRWVRHGGWYPDYQLRLLRVDRARYDEAREVHELVVLDGPAGWLRQPLEHDNYRTVGQFIAKQRQYASLDARTLWRRGVRPRRRDYLARPLRELQRRCCEHHGYRDGPHGLLLAGLLAYYTLSTYVQLARLWREGSPPARG